MIEDKKFKFKSRCVCVICLSVLLLDLKIYSVLMNTIL